MPYYYYNNKFYFDTDTTIDQTVAKKVSDEEYNTLNDEASRLGRVIVDDLDGNPTLKSPPPTNYFHYQGDFEWNKNTQSWDLNYNPVNYKRDLLTLLESNKQILSAQLLPVHKSFKPQWDDLTHDVKLVKSDLSNIDQVRDEFTLVDLVNDMDNLADFINAIKQTIYVTKLRKRKLQREANSLEDTINSLPDTATLKQALSVLAHVDSYFNTNDLSQLANQVGLDAATLATTGGVDEY